MFQQKRLFIFLVLFFSMFALQAQQGQLAVPLKQILEEISTKNNIKFNYIDEELIIYKLIPPKENLSLLEKINYIQSKTGLNFKPISDNYYSIYNNRKLDKPLCGYLLEEETGLPIENASINILGTQKIVFSDQKGYFELPLISPNTIEISHLNF
jgi:hypothetical protein